MVSLGETEPLKQLGINMSVANLEAFALSQGIEKTYNSMTQAEQATLRYNYLMSVTKDAQGDFAKTSDSFANQQRILELNFETLSATLGEMILPTLNSLLKSVNNLFAGAKDISKWMKDNEQTLTVLGILLGTLTTAILAYNIAINATTIMTSIATTATSAFGAVMAFITSPVTLVILAIGALIAIGYNLIKNWDLIKSTAINVFNWLVNFFESVGKKIIKAFEGMYDIGKNIVEGIWNGISGTAGWLYNKVKSFANGIIDNIKKALEIHSPSRKARDLIGKMIPQGVAVGVEADTDKAVKSINNMNNQIEREMKKAVYGELGNINASANVKANNTFANTMTVNSKFDGSVVIDGKSAGRILAPYISNTYRTAGAY